MTKYHPRNSSICLRVLPFFALVLSSVQAASLIQTHPRATLTRNVSLPIVNLGYAQYEGFVDATLNITNFLSIRYATPPIGALRFQAPTAPENVFGLQSATEEPPQCYQTTFGLNPGDLPPPNDITKRDVVSSEDCLFLNIHVPGTLPSTAKLPVLVWIHGGGYIFGNANQYNGEDLIRQSGHGVVVVIIQYRLGLFGFLSGSQVKAHGALNAGLLDQNFALQWVQQHIGKFGGDPAKVTIWGESAGGGSVIQHIVAHNGKTLPPLFRAGIASSGFLPSQYQYNDRIPESIYSEAVNQTNCSASNDTFSCIQAADANILQAANVKINKGGFYGTFTTVPVVDGTFIVQRPTEILKQGTVNGEVLLSVTNAHEGDIFVNSSSPISSNVTEYITRLFPGLEPEQISVAVNLYASTGLDVLGQIEAIIGDSVLVCPTYFVLEAFDGRAFKGEFAVPNALHGDDTSYYFLTGGFGNPRAFNNTIFINSFVQSFLAFARSLTPNAKFDRTDITPRWSAWTRDNPAEMLFNVSSAREPVVQPIVTDGALLERCNFWNSVGGSTRQ